MPRTAQAAMRHSKIDLTMNIYTDPKLLDVHGALDSLPLLGLNSPYSTERQPMRATGTHGRDVIKTQDIASGQFAPAFAPDSADSVIFQQTPAHSSTNGDESKRRGANGTNPTNPSEKASIAEVASEASEGVANRIRTGDIQNHNLARRSSKWESVRSCDK